MQFVDLHTQYQRLKQRIDNRIQSVLDHGQFIAGPEVTELEERLANYVGSKYCITVANGTDALQLSLMALNIGLGDAVFTTSFSFFATAEAIAILGAKPVFVDIDPATYNICPKSLRCAIENYNEEEIPKAIISVDLFGLPAEYPAIKRIAIDYNLDVIEDAAQGLGGKIGDDMAGTFGDISTTSFFPSKPLGCYGDGGAVFTSDENIADRIFSLRSHGQGKNKYENIQIGMNSRLDTIQAAILLEKLMVFEDEIQQRNRIAEIYQARLNKRVTTPQIPPDYRSAWAQYTIASNNRDQLQETLLRQGVPSAIYYPTPLHEQRAFKHLNPNNQNLKHVISACKKVISLPMNPYLDEDSVERVALALQSSISEN